MPHRHAARSNRAARRRANFTTRADFSSAGEYECDERDETSPPSSVGDISRPGAPIPTPTPFPTSTESKMSFSVELTKNSHCDLSPNVKAVWGNGEDAASKSVDEESPPLIARQVTPLTSLSSHTSPKSATKAATPQATPRFSLPPRRRKSPLALKDSKVVTMVDASTQTETASTLTSVALSFIKINSGAALLASSMMHQAATAIQRRFKRHVTRTEFFRKKAESSIKHQENIQFARYLSRVLALHSLHLGDKKINYSWECRTDATELQREPKFGGIPLSLVDARALELTIVSPETKCAPSEMTIDSAVVLIFEQQQLSLRVSVDKFPCTRDEWYKYIFWPVHANGGDHQYLDERRIHVNTSPYAKLATAMRAPSRTTGAPSNPGYQRGFTYMRTNKITEELRCSLNRLELRKAPPVRLRLHYASLSAYQRAITPKLKYCYQSSIAPASAPTSALTLPVPASSVFTHQQGESTQDARTVLSSVRSGSDRRNSSPTPSFDNAVPSFVRDTMITRAAELMSDMQLFATVDASPQPQSDRDDSKLARGLNLDTTEPTQQRDEPVDRWAPSSHATHYARNSPADSDYDDGASDHRGHDHAIHFGLHPKELFDRAHSRGAYHEFEERNGHGTQRGFEFRLDSNQHDDDYSSSDGTVSDARRSTGSSH